MNTPYSDSKFIQAGQGFLNEVTGLPVKSLLVTINQDKDNSTSWKVSVDNFEGTEYNFETLRENEALQVYNKLTSKQENISLEDLLARGFKKVVG